MSYEDLVKKSWNSGDFKIDRKDGFGAPQITEAGGAQAARQTARAEIERIVVNEKETAALNDAGRHPEAKMKLAKFVKFREEKFGGVLFETRQEKVYTLNPTAAAVVREVVAGEGDVMTKVLSRFSGDTTQIQAEVDAFLSDLKEKGLVTE